MPCALFNVAGYRHIRTGAHKISASGTTAIVIPDCCTTSSSFYDLHDPESLIKIIEKVKRT